MASAEELREIQALSSSISQIMDQISDKSDKRNRALEREANTMKSITSDLKDVEDINKALEGLDRRRGQIQKTNYGVNQSLKSDLLKMNQISIDALNTERKKLQVLQRVNEISSNIGNSLASSIDKFKSKVAEVPVLGKAISKLIPSDKLNSAIGEATAGFQRGFGVMFKRGLSQQQGFVKSFGAGMRGGLGQVSKSLGPLLANPYVLAAAAIAAMLGAGLIAFKKLADASKEFRNETGLLRSQTEGVDTAIFKSYKSTVLLGASMDEVAKVAAQFTNTFEGLVTPSKEVLTSVVALNKNFGVATQNAIGANQVFQNMAGLSAEQAQYQVQQVALASQLAGVAPDRVLADIANSAEVAANYFSGSVTDLSKAAVQAAALGTSIKEAAAVADNLLDFESSINAELEASAMLGQSINFNKARELAATGDILGAQQSVLDSLESTVDLNKLNKFQLDSIAKASGMPVAELQKQLNIRKQFGKLDSAGMKAAEQLLASGKQLSDISSEDLKKQTEQVIAQQQMQSEFDTMKNQLKAISSDLLMAFLPMGKLLMGIIKPIMALISGIFKPISTALKGVMEAFKPIQDIMSDVFGDGAGISSIFKVIGKIIAGPITFGINLLANNLKRIFSLIGGIYNVFKGIFTGDLSMITDGLMDIGESILRFFFAIPVALYDTLVDMFPSIGSFFSGLGSTILDAFNSIGPSLINFFGSIVKGWFNIITFIPTKIYEAFTSVFPTIGEYISNFFTSILDYIKGLFDFSSIFSGISSFLGFGSTVESTGGVDVAMAEGGVVTGPTKALIGEAGPEAVIPLNGVDVMGSGAIVAAIEQLGNDIKNLQVQVNMDGRKVADGVSKVVQRSNINNFGVTT